MDDAAEQRLLARFSERFERETPYKRDHEIGPRLLEEVRPVAQSLAAATAGGGFDILLPEHGEALALVTLLGRRAAALDLSTTASAGIMRALSDALADDGWLIPEGSRTQLTALFLEGFVTAREETVGLHAAGRIVGALRAVEVVPRVLLLSLSGSLEASEIGEIVESLGRDAFRRDAVATIVVLSGLEDPTPERAAELFSADVSARMLGAQCWFVGVTDAWYAAAREGRVDLALISLRDSVEAVLEEALPMAGRTLRPTSWIPGPLRNLLTKR